MKMLNRATLTALLMAPAIALPGVALADTRVTFTTGVDYSSGDYGGTEETEVVRVPLIGRVITDNWEFRATVPFLSITGPADVADPDDPNGGTIVRTGTDTGLGDVALEVTRNFEDLGGSNVYFDATGWVRLETGDKDRGLGNGATDYALIGELGNSGDNGGVYVSAGRRFLGDDGSTTPRRDGWQARVGGWFATGDNSRIGAAYSWREASKAGREDPSEVSAYMSFQLNEQLGVSVSGGAGLSDASADYRAGVRLTWRSQRADRRDR